MFYKRLKLDEFQISAIEAIEQRKSIIVSAPTGAGKTLIAEYAIEKFIKEGKKIIYTAPIKALSNQKYRDFSRTYLNPKSSAYDEATADRQIPNSINSINSINSTNSTNSINSNNQSPITNNQTNPKLQIPNPKSQKSTEHRAQNTVNSEHSAVGNGQKNLKSEIYNLQSQNTNPQSPNSNNHFPFPISHFPLSNIGIVTGDVIINRDAPVLIMTTEIIRNIIFSEPQSLSDVEYIIFDEIHYINDIERGTVWEESIIFAPQNVAFICLSATIPNIDEFSQWMQSVRDIEVKTIVNYERPVPLKYSVYVKGFGVKDIDNIPWGKGKKKTKDEKSLKKRKLDKNYEEKFSLISYLYKNNLLPALYFIFNRRECGKSAFSVYSRNFLNNSERGKVANLFDEYAELFNISDKDNTKEMRKLILQGVAYHHAGLLPAMKEIIERLYTLGLIKVLFTTETFAVGINMPAKSVVFDNLRKHDGISFRPLTVREFQQMAGRAGRRGIDEVGYVFPMVDLGVDDKQSLEYVLSNKIEDIESQINLSYSSILNIYERYGSAGIYEVYEKSFKKFTYSLIPRLINERIKRISEYIKSLEDFKSDKCSNRDLLIYKERAKDLKRRQLRFKRLMRGKSYYRNSVHSFKLEKLEREIGKSQNNLRDFECDKCPDIGNCIQRLREIEKKKKELMLLKDPPTQSSSKKGEIRGIYTSFSTDDLRKRISFLKEMDYLDEDGLLARGKIAEKIFGSEIQITELYFKGYFIDFSEEMINMALLSILYEARHPGRYDIFRNPNLQMPIRKFRSVENIIQYIRRIERKNDIRISITMPDFRLCPAMKKWCGGASFEEILNYTDEDEGDIVRTFRHVVDFLRQMKRAFDFDRKLTDKLSNCVDLIYRNEIDAEAQLSVTI